MPVVVSWVARALGFAALVPSLCGCTALSGPTDLPTSLLPLTTADHHAVRVQLRVVLAPLDCRGSLGLQSLVLAPESGGGAISGRPEAVLIDSVDVTACQEERSLGEMFRSIRNANGQVVMAPAPMGAASAWRLRESGGSIGWRARAGNPLRVVNWRNASQDFGDVRISYDRIGLLPDFRVLQVPAVEANRGDLSRFRLVLAGLPQGTRAALELGLRATRDPLLAGGQPLAITAGRTGLTITTPAGYSATVRASGTYNAVADARGYVDLDFSQLSGLPRWYVLGVGSYAVSVMDPS